MIQIGFSQALSEQLEKERWQPPIHACRGESICSITKPSATRIKQSCAWVG